MHRIVFTGTQGTGKTTVLKEFEKEGLRVITEVVRKLAKEGVKINKDGDEDGQTKIFEAYTKLLSMPEDGSGYISDRCLIDVVAYSMYLGGKGVLSDEFVNNQINALINFKDNNPGIVYCYFPIEFAVVDDGVRDMDEEFRSEIDKNIRILFQITGIQPVIIRGTVEERTTKIKRVIGWVYEGYDLISEKYEPVEIQQIEEDLTTETQK